MATVAVENEKTLDDWLYHRKSWLKYFKSTKHPSHCFYGLSARAIGYCWRRGLKDKNALLQDYQSGQFHYIGPRWVGKKTYLEVCSWLGVVPLRKLVNFRNGEYAHRFEP